MTSYAAQKGRAARLDKPSRPAPAKPLSEAEEARVADNKDFILAHMPEMLPIIRDLHADGLVDGRRNFVRCTLLDHDQEQHHIPDSRRTR